MLTKSKIITSIAMVVVIGVAIIYATKQRPQPPTVPAISKQGEQTMRLTSSVFQHNQTIPAKYTCDGEDINPPLAISNVPANAKSLVLIVDDPDAPRGDWVHWTIWNIKPDTVELAENSVPIGAVEGTTDFGRTGWGGPCPPSGVHHYQFKLYALDTELTLPASARKADIEAAMQGHGLEQANLLGLYQRP